MRESKGGGGTTNSEERRFARLFEVARGFVAVGGRSRTILLVLGRGGGAGGLGV